MTALRQHWHASQRVAVSRKKSEYRQLRSVSARFMFGRHLLPVILNTRLLVPETTVTVGQGRQYSALPPFAGAQQDSVRDNNPFYSTYYNDTFAFAITFVPVPFVRYQVFRAPIVPMSTKFDKRVDHEAGPGECLGPCPTRRPTAPLCPTTVPPRIPPSSSLSQQEQAPRFCRYVSPSLSPHRHFGIQFPINHQQCTESVRKTHEK